MSMLKKELICFGISVLLFLSVFSGLYYFYRDDIFLTALMLTPAASVVITRVLTKEWFAGLHLKPNFKGNIKLYLAAYFGTPAAAFSGAVIYFTLFRSKWEPLMSPYAIEIGCKTNEEYFQNLAVMIPLAVLINPLMGLLQCFGEEFAWRGYLLPKLNIIFSYRTAVIVNGIIWGLWHAPIIAMGYNYGSEHPIWGIFAMTLFTVILGMISSFLFSAAQSVWCPVVFHAAINAMDKFSPSALFMRAEEADPFIGPDLNGIIGGIGFIVIAVIIFIKYTPSKDSEQLTVNNYQLIILFVFEPSSAFISVYPLVCCILIC